jgi:hypothetical protein
VGVRFLRTQQRVKSQCLYRLGRFYRPGRPVPLRLWGGGDFFEAMLSLFGGMAMPGLFPEVWPVGVRPLVGRVALMESLILAQDERWRRA